MDRFLQNNTVLRIIAIILSCILWLTVNAPGANSSANQSGTIERQFSFPVQVETAPNMVATKVSNPTVVISVNVDVLSVSSLSAQMLGVAVVANARGLGPGSHSLSVAAVNIPAYNYTITPSTISVFIERKTQSQRTVKLNVGGTPAPGYMTGTPTTDTPIVTVQGSKETVESVKSVVADVSVQGMKQAVTKPVPLIALDASGKPVTNVDLNPAQVTVTVPIEAPQMTANVVPQVVGSAAAGYAISGLTMNPNSVVVYGTPDVLPQLQTITVPIHVSGLRQTTTVHTSIPLPSGITKVVPSSVAATVTIEPSASKFLSGIPIQVENAPTGTQVTLSGTDKVDITVSGPQSLVQKLTSSSISVYVDASKLTHADTSAPVNVMLPNWIQVNQLSVNQVPVVVK